MATPHDEGALVAPGSDPIGDARRELVNENLAAFKRDRIPVMDALLAKLIAARDAAPIGSFRRADLQAKVDEGLELRSRYSAPLPRPDDKIDSV